MVQIDIRMAYEFKFLFTLKTGAWQGAKQRKGTIFSENDIISGDKFSCMCIP